MLIRGKITEGGIEVGTQIAKLSAFGTAFNASNNGRPAVLVEITKPVVYLSMPTESVEDVITPEIDQCEEAGILVFDCDDPSPLQPWLRDDGIPIETRKKRLAQVGRLLDSLESATTSDGPFFMPYFCPGAIVLGRGDRARLLGAAWEFDYSDEDSIPNSVRRYVSHRYLEIREVEGKADRPQIHDDTERRAYMRFGFGVMVWETATGCDQFPERGVRPDMELDPEWEPVRELVLMCLGHEEWGDSTLSEQLASALGPPKLEPSDTEEQALPQIHDPRPIVENPVAGKSRQAAVFFGLVLGVLLAVGGAWYCGVNPLDPTEIQRLRLDLKQLQSDLANSNLYIWSATSPDSKRETELEEEIVKGEPGSTYLNYMKLLQAKTRDAGWLEEAKSLQRRFLANPTDYPALKETDFEGLVSLPISK